jgi:hypothetical protein
MRRAATTPRKKATSSEAHQIAFSQALRRREPDFDEVAGHIGGKGAAEPQIADRIDIAGDAGEQGRPQQVPFSR